MQKQTLIAKITRPRLPKVLSRKRLFILLDRGRRAPVVWVNGPAGSGKTTLVASYIDSKKLPCLWYQLDEGDSDIATFFYYLGLAAKRAAPHFKKNPLPLLTTEYLGGVSTFTKRYFENLCSRFRPPHVIVLDNYHHLAADSLFHDMLREALAVIPEGITVIITSRGAPPPSLALLNTYKKIHAISWDDLKFDLNETRSLLEADSDADLAEETVEQLHHFTEGWAAGLTLLKERIRSSTSPHELSRLRTDEFFDYFATELFQKADEGTQNILLKTSFLPYVSSKVAVELTGNVQAGSLLAALSRNQFFTERRPGPDPIYQYHLLFRAFLQAQAKQTYAITEIRALLCRAAELLEAADQVEDAADLYRTSETWEGLIRVILSKAEALMSQGRHRLLDVWFASLPAVRLEQDPWLLYWRAMCRMPFALLDAREYFEKAFSLFRERREASGVYLAWSGIVESFIQELDVSKMDSWIAILEPLMDEYPAFPSPDIEGHVTTCMFIALSLRMPWHPDFDLWKDKAIALLDGSAEATLRMLCGFYLLIHLLVVGDVALCERVMSRMRVIISSNKNVSPLAYITAKFADSWLAWQSSSYEHSLKMMDEGLQKSSDSGVHRWDYLLLFNGGFASLMAGDVRRSKELLGKMSYALEYGRPLDKFYYYWLASWQSMLESDIQGAISLSSTGLGHIKKVGILGGEARGRLAHAHYLHKTGKYKQAKEHVEKSRAIGQRMKSSIIIFCCDLEASAIAFAEGDEETGLTSLGNAMSLGRERGYAAFNFAFFQNEELSFLCVKALETGIEPDFVTEMIRKRNLVPEAPPMHVENWPWAVKIYTLGRFEIVVNGKPLRFAGKVQKKPLEMLKILIALGGQNVSEDRFIDALWPEADGDTAYISFKSTLHRLRKLLGGEEFIQLGEGMMSLDRRSCWVDAWAFERIIEDAGREDRQSETYPRLLEKAVAMYRGHFLGDDSDRPWAASLRERLRGKFIRTVDALVDYWSGQDDTIRSWSKKISQSSIKKAIECLERGLEIDDVAEEFYQNLIVCHQEIGNKAEAVKAYRRCCDTLSASLGVAPSEKTRLIYEKIIGTLP